MKCHQHINALEARLEEMQDLLLVKIKELEAFQETTDSLRHELESLKAMLDEDEKQQVSNQLSLQNKTSGQLESILPESLATAVKPSRFSKSADFLWPKEEKNSASPVADKFLQRPASVPVFHNREINKLRQGQTHVYVNTLFKESKKEKEKKHKKRDSTKRDSSYNTVISSAIGNMKIAEVDPSGHCVRLLNSSEKEEDIGDYILQQNVGGHPVTKYRFPSKIRVKARTTVTVWAARANMFHNPPSEFVWKEQNMFGTGTEYTTILCKPNGHAIAWYTPMHWNRAPVWDQYSTADEIQKAAEELKMQAEARKDEIIEKYDAEPGIFMMTESEPFISEAEEIFDWYVPTQGSKSQIWDQYPSMTNQVQRSAYTKDVEDKRTRESKPDIGRVLKMKSRPASPVMEEAKVVPREEKSPVLLQREKTTSIVLPPPSSPWTQSIASVTHPDYALSRALPMGNDGSSFCRQARTQSTIFDPETGNLYAGGQRSKDMGFGGASSKRKIRSAGEEMQI